MVLINDRIDKGAIAKADEQTKDDEHVGCMTKSRDVGRLYPKKF